MISKISNFSGPNSVTFKLTSQSSVGGALNLLILGDASVGTVATLVGNRLNTLGYTYSISTQRLSTTYTGAGLTPASFSTILMYTNGSDTGTSTLSTNLINYTNNGGNFVTAVFMWNLSPSGFSYSRTAFIDSPRGQSSRTAGATMSIDVPHVITTGISTAIGASFENTTTTLSSGSTKIATSSTGRPLIGIRDSGTYKIASFNSFPPQMTAVQTQLMVNCILWANGNIS